MDTASDRITAATWNSRAAADGFPIRLSFQEHRSEKRHDLMEREESM